MKIRELRLQKEFQRMCKLDEDHPHKLFDFICADLSSQEAAEFLKSSVSIEVIEQALPGYLTPAEFKRRMPGRAPEKYLIEYRCAGLAITDTGGVSAHEKHRMSVIFKYDYPSKPPMLIWHTPLWHPNIRPPGVCPHGRKFAVSVPLDQIVLTVGEMVQYRNFNLSDPFNHDAAAWARQNLDKFPVDQRDLLDGRKLVNTRAPVAACAPDMLVELLDAPLAGPTGATSLIELLE
jgi:ubiquitin-protein ligase